MSIATITATSAPPTIRLLREADLPAALELWRQTPGIGMSRTSDHLPELAAFLLRNPTTSFALCEGEELTGTILAGYDGRRGFIYHLAIHQDRQRGGFGRRLLDAACEALRVVGARKVHLFVLKENEDACAFYRRLGWIERRDIQVFTLEL